MLNLYFIYIYLLTDYNISYLNNIKMDDILNYYHMHEKKLGEGGFAKVRLGTHLATGLNVAIKCLDKQKLGPELPRIYNEIECLKKLKHQNIARLYQVFETDSMIYLVLECCAGGELFDYIVSKSKLDEPEAAQIIYDLMRVLDFIHINGFAHRDLKPENVLFNDKHHIKLIDFGLAANCSTENMISKFDQAPLDQLRTCCGSVTYAAPEVISGGIYSGTTCDVWSAGIMLYALLVGQLPFNDNSIPKLYQKIQGGLKALPPFLSPEASDLIRKMLVVDPTQRIKVRQILAHPFLRNRTHTFARINRRLEFDSTNQLDEQLLIKCCEKFPTLTKEQLRDHIKNDFNYYSTAYHLMKNTCPPRSMAVKRTPQRYFANETTNNNNNNNNSNTTPIVAPYVSPMKRTRFVTVSTTPTNPRTPPSYLHQLQMFHTPNKIPTRKTRSSSLDQENNQRPRTTPKKSIVKRLLDSVTPSKRKKPRMMLRSQK